MTVNILKNEQPLKIIFKNQIKIIKGEKTKVPSNSKQSSKSHTETTFQIEKEQDIRLNYIHELICMLC